MNKIAIALIAGLVVFAAIAQLAQAKDTNELVNEIEDDVEIDDELEGGFGQDGAYNLGVKPSDYVVYDPLDKGTKKIYEGKVKDCADKKRKSDCKQCCTRKGHATSFKGPSLIGTCTCVERNSKYTTSS